MLERLAATFARRKTESPSERPDALTKAFVEDATKIQLWTFFVELLETQPRPLTKVVEDLASFLMPHVEAARKTEMR